MINYINPPESGDPSLIKQNFNRIKINIHCCRYWWLSKWKHKRLAYPFWRLYFNINEGAYIYYKKKTKLGPDKIILIPPFTPFSTDLINSDKNSDYGLRGGWIKSQEIEDSSMLNGRIQHFYMHFNLGYPLDNVLSGVYSIEGKTEELEIIKEIKEKLISGSMNFSLIENLLLNKLIISLLAKLPNNIWIQKKIDTRIQNVIYFMNKNFNKHLTNNDLASISKMAENSFARLFKKETGKSPFNYLTKLRIENACNLLYHTDTSIDKIAEDSGFSDRYYFSRVFKKEMDISPGKYRKQFILQ